MADRIKGEEHSWGDVVKRGPFEQILLASAGVPITYLLLTSHDAAEGYLLLDPWLSMMCFAFASLRVWKTAKEESESAAAWEGLAPFFSRTHRLVDLILEWPWVFVNFVLPFLAVSYQVLVIGVFVFYAVDTWRNHEFVKHLPACLEKHSDRQEERGEWRLRDYFVKRFWLSVVFGCVSVLSWAGSWAFACWNMPQGFLGIGFVTMVTLILGEGLVEPILNVDFHVPSKLGLEPVRRNTVVCQAARDQLQRIHVNAFQPDEQYYSMEYMLQAAREGSHEFRIIGYSGQLVGYLCYEKGIAGKEDAALWYLAIEKERRGEGLGGKAIKAFLDELRESPDPVRYCLLECHRPSHGAPPSDFDRRRVKFYTRQGAYWLKDLEYGVPSHTDHSRTIPYEVLVFPIAGPIEREKVKQAVLALAGAGMKPDDDRYRRLEASLDSMVIQPPPGAEGKCSSED